MYLFYWETLVCACTPNILGSLRPKMREIQKSCPRLPERGAPGCFTKRALMSFVCFTRALPALSRSWNFQKNATEETEFLNRYFFIHTHALAFFLSFLFYFLSSRLSLTASLRIGEKKSKEERKRFVGMSDKSSRAGTKLPEEQKSIFLSEPFIFQWQINTSEGFWWIANYRRVFKRTVHRFFGSKVTRD